MCFPFTRSKSGGSAASGSRDLNEKPVNRPSSLNRSHTLSSTSTLTSKPDALTFTSDSISYRNVPIDETTKSPRNSKGTLSPVLSRHSSGSGGGPGAGVGDMGGAIPGSLPSRSSSGKSKLFSALKLSRNNSSSSTLVGSALDRKIADTMVPPEPPFESTLRLAELRKLLVKEKLDFYVIPSTDAHGSEYLAPCDKRREWISGFTGSSGTALVSQTQASLFTDSRYYIQAAQQLDDNWTLQKVGWEGQVDWSDYLLTHPSTKGRKIGIDSRLISVAQANKLLPGLTARGSSLTFPYQNLVDLIWKDRPKRPREPVYVQPVQFSGVDAREKVERVRGWIRENRPEGERYKPLNPPQPKDIPVAAFFADLADIAWILNLRGSDIPYTPVFMAYLFVRLQGESVLFVEKGKVGEEVSEYLREVGVVMREYSDVWPFLRGKDWGEGKILITPNVPYTVARSLTSLRYALTLTPYISLLRCLKNPTEVAGMERAYLRDAVAMIRWLAWLDEKISLGYEIEEYQAAGRLKEFRAGEELYQGLAYEAIVATGPNAALPHYTPQRHGSRVIDRKTPFLVDAGGQYRDGTCDTTRTVHFGKPTDQQAEAFTRVLQGHIAIDSAIFPEGTAGSKMDIMARRALWQDGLNYGHGTGHGVGSFLSVHELNIGFGSDVPLQPGHVISNEPGFYLENEFGVRIESVLVVERMRTKHDFGGAIWLGFRRLTQVPIQLKLIKASMLTREEVAWVKNHNEECRRKLEPLLKNDKRAIRYLRRECAPTFRSETSISGVSIEWN